MEDTRTHLDGFQQRLLADGFAPAAAKNYRFRISTFLRACPDALGLDETDARIAVEGYVSALSCNTARTIPAAAVRKWWSYKFGKPYHDRITPSSCIGDEAIDGECDGFSAYLEAHGNICEQTRRKRVGAIRVFLYTTYPDGTFVRGHVTLDDIVDYHVKSSSDQGPSMRSMQGSDLRSYARYLRSEGVEIASLDSISLSGPARRGRIVPGRLCEEDYRKLLDSCDGDTLRGARDLAMATCMGNLGLRACDVARLSLDDVNWADGTVTVHDSKSRTERTLPLDRETGGALERYALRRSPDGRTRTLFVNTHGNPITSSQVQTAISLAAGRACIDAYHGTHGLRRMVATNMVNAGVDVKSIADVLGHERIDTTVRYMKIGVDNLRRVASHWPGGGGDE